MRVKKKDDVVKIKSDASYVEDNKLLMKITDTGNGFICHSPSWNCLDQDNYICMDYSQAHLIYVALKEFGVEGWD
jgi:hypothetical protein